MAKAEYRSAIRSRKLINAALADLLQEKPLDKITVTDVVSRAGINRGTFYAHYTDIPDVINHLIQQLFANIQDVLSEQPRQLADIPHVLLARIQTFLECDFDFIQKVMTSSAATLMQEQLTEVVQEYLFQREADFSFGNHEEYVLMIRFCAGGLSSLYCDWFAGKLPMTLTELTNKGEELLVGIISTGK